MTSAYGMTVIGLIARQELRIILRNRWVVAYAGVFAALTLAVSYFGLSVIEFTGFQGFERTTASLLNLVLYIVPLVGMLMAVQSFSVEGGATDQLFTEPVTRGEIVLGKLAGIVAANILATLFGFGMTGLLIARQVGTQGLGDYAVLVAYTILIGMVFAALGSLITVITRRTLRAYAAVIVTWFLLALLFDLLIIGVSFLLPEGWANRLAFAGLFLNPIDAARIATLLVVSGKEMFGVAGALLTRSLGGVLPAEALLTTALLCWCFAPVALAISALRRQDL